MRSAGLLGEIANRSAFGVVSAYYQRPWSPGAACSLDDVILLSARHNVDPYPLMKMLWENGELPPESDESPEGF